MRLLPCNIKLLSPMTLLLATCFMLLLSLLPVVLAVIPALAPEEGDDLTIIGLEVEKLLNLMSGALAFALLLITLVAYKHTRRTKLLYVSAAFLLFAIKGFLTSAELFFGEWAFVDPVTSTFDFAILLCFFLGLIKK